MTHKNSNLQKEEPLVLVQFYADWCQPCGIMMPIVESNVGISTQVSKNGINCIYQ